MTSVDCPSAHHPNTRDTILRQMLVTRENNLCQVPHDCPPSQRRWKEMTYGRRIISIDILFLNKENEYNLKPPKLNSSRVCPHGRH